MLLLVVVVVGPAVECVNGSDRAPNLNRFLNYVSVMHRVPSPEPAVDQEHDRQDEGISDSNKKTKMFTMERSLTFSIDEAAGTEPSILSH